LLNFEVEPALLASRVPDGTSLDTFEGRTFLSLVGFQFRDVRVWGVPVPFHRNFDEVNLRFYVRREVNGELRRGVVFIMEIVPRRAVAYVARRFYNENYVALPMRHEDTFPGSPHPRVAYYWKHRGSWNHLALRAQGDGEEPDLQSEQSFIAEHYWGYVRQRDGSTLEYRVEHPRWKVWRGDEVEFKCDVAALYGNEFAPWLQGPPSSAFLADGSAVTVFRGSRLSPRH
jgi:uncharacterized protein YqjF (DUF2071 family)